MVDRTNYRIFILSIILKMHEYDIFEMFIVFSLFFKFDQNILINISSFYIFFLMSFDI